MASDFLPFVCAGFDTLGQRFASVYKALDSFRLRVSSVSSQENQEIALPKGVQPSSLKWVSSGPKGAKKRKRSADPEPSEDYICVGAFGRIIVYSCARHEIVKTLELPNSQIVDLLFHQNTLYSLSNDGALIKWDLVKGSRFPFAKFEIDDLEVIASLPNKSFIIASTMPHLIQWDDPNEIAETFSGFVTPIRQVAVEGESFWAIAEEDRQIQAYSANAPGSRSFMCPSNVSYIASGPDDHLAAVCEDGKVRVLNAQGDAVSEISVKRSTGASVTVQQAQFLGEFLVLVWSEQGVIPAFERVQWRDAGEVTLTKDSIVPKVSDHLKNGRDAASSAAYKEAGARVLSGAHMSGLDDEEATLADRLETLEVDEHDGEADDGDDDEDAPVHRSLQLSTPGSFAVLLNQALLSDDKQLLETCLQEKDEKLIKSSIMRLDPSLATKLLEKLAEKISRVQHRSTRLLVWVRWVMIIHGGHLVTVSSLLKTLASLYSTLSARSATLPKLLALQGRLDLLSSQIELRKEVDESKREIEEEVPEFVYNGNEVIVNGEEDFEMDDIENDRDSEEELSDDDGESFEYEPVSPEHPDDDEEDDSE